MSKSSTTEASDQSTSKYEEYLNLAEAGDINAQYNLGIFLQTGTGVIKNSTEAARWFKKAADQGHARAQFCFGSFLENGIGVAKKDEKEAARYYLMSAEQGFFKSQNNLGVFLKNGRGTFVRQDTAQAARYFRSAADKGLDVAQYNLGDCLRHGDGIDVDKVEAFACYYKSAIQGFHKAQYELGTCFEDGIGTEKDLTEALLWYNRAARQNNADAQLKLGTFLYSGTGGKKNSSESILWYCRAASQGNKTAIHHLTGKDLFFGYGVKFRKDADNTPLVTKEIIEIAKCMKSLGRANSNASTLIGSLVELSFSRKVIKNEQELRSIIDVLLEGNATINENKSRSCVMINNCIRQLRSVARASATTDSVAEVAATTSQNLAGSEERAVQPPSHKAEINSSMLIDLTARIPSASAGVELGSREMLASEVVSGNNPAGGAGIALGFTEPVIVEDFSAAAMGSPAATAAPGRSSSPVTLSNDTATEIPGTLLNDAATENDRSVVGGTTLSFSNNTAAPQDSSSFTEIEDAVSVAAAAGTPLPSAAASGEGRGRTIRTAKSTHSSPLQQTTTSKSPIAQAYLRSITKIDPEPRPRSSTEADSPSIEFDPSAARALSDKHKSQPHKKG